ncbi:DUF998 domain-containing protein [Streptomyces sp. BV286]|uniref:DUF998 domain-containing protein n=1 Tax=Streptomyces sp. BV286 TaxID=2849672 RepID=UPI001C2EB2C5|nr:DUF998 domain-containing protein [Streptomyces sp. BV286]MBV1942538.1 DUF998 domain-containing protein [Streptomyces sp. BV286]
MQAFLVPPSTLVDHHAALRHLTTVAYAALSGSVVLGALLHLQPSGHVDPVEHTLSEYALHEGTAGLFTACVGAAAAGAAALLAGLLRSPLPTGTAAPAALSVGCAGLVLSAVFPTDPKHGGSSLGGLVHRYAAGASLAALPAVGLLLARGLQRHSPLRERARRVRLLSCSSSAGVLLFFATHVSAARPVTPMTGRVSRLLGLTERTALGLEMALLLAMVNTLRGGRGR